MLIRLKLGKGEGMREKLEKIHKLTTEGKYSLVKHINGFEIICQEDCNGWEEDNTPNLRVDCFTPDLVKMKHGEILIDADIISVEEYKQ